MEQLSDVLILVGIPVAVVVALRLFGEQPAHRPVTEPSWMRAAGFRPAEGRAPRREHEPAAVTPAPVVQAALFSIAAALMHVSVIGEHMRESAVYGVFFIAASVGQLLWAIAVLVRPSRRRMRLGALANGVIALVWIVSRTIGLPLGPEPFQREAIGVLGVLSTMFEGAIVGLWWISRSRPEIGVTSRMELDRPTKTIAVLLGITVAAAVIFGGGH